MIAAMTVLLLGLGLTACTSSGTPPPRTLVVGAQSTPAMTVLARIYATVLRNTGANVSADLTTGTYPQLLDAMGGGRLDLFPAGSGALLADLAPQQNSTSSEDVYNDLNRSLPQGVSVGDPTTVAAAPQIFVASSLAERSGATDLASCARLPEGLPVVTASAPDPGVVAAFSTAGCRLGPTEILGSTTAVVDRVASGSALGILSPLDVDGGDAGAAATSLQALTVATTTTGPRAQDLVPVYRTAALSRDQVKAINKVAGELTTADLAAMAGKARSGANPSDLAATWLAEHGL